MFHIKTLNELLIINIRKSSYTPQTEGNTHVTKFSCCLSEQKGQ